MKNKEFSSVMQYVSTMNVIENWLEKGLISDSDYAEIDTIIAEKYGISSCSIYRRNSLLLPRS